MTATHTPALFTSLCGLALFLVSSVSAHAQAAGGNPAAAPGNNNGTASDPGRISDVETKDGRWDCSLPGGNYTIGIGKIISTSIHRYIIPTPATSAGPVPLPTTVHEVNIDTDGAMVVRFYYVEAATEASALNVTKVAMDRLNQVANEAANRTGSVKPWQMVQKDYPASTHAHTIEFRVETLDDLHRLYGSVKRSWITGKGAQFSVK